uniref:Uncharacterized protein n=1 Tax=Meloidogyne incognita TaxID=6306 RepID=A0A914MPG7_MELIC
MLLLNNGHKENSIFNECLEFLRNVNFKPSNCPSIGNNLIRKCPNTSTRKYIPDMNERIISSSNNILKFG